MTRERFIMPGEGEPGGPIPPPADNNEGPRPTPGPETPNIPRNPFEGMTPEQAADYLEAQAERIRQQAQAAREAEGGGQPPQGPPTESRPPSLEGEPENPEDIWSRVADQQRRQQGQPTVPPSDEVRQEALMRSRMYGDALSSQLMEALVNKDFDQADAVIEGRLRAVEEDEQDVAGQQQNVQQLMHIVDSVFATKDEWRLELAEKLHARLQLHLGNFTSRYIGGEALSGVITNFQQRHWQSILRTAGVRRMIQFLEEKDETGAVGAYYRNTEADPESPRYSKYKKFFNYDSLDSDKQKSARQKMWIMDRQIQLIKEARGSADHLGFKYIKDYTENSELIQYALTKLEETDLRTSRSKNSFTVIQEMISEAKDQDSRLHQILPQEDIQKLLSFIYIQKTNPRTGQPLLDEQGNPVFELDAKGNPIPSPQTDQGSFELNKFGQDFDWLMYELQRSLRLASRAHLTTTQANSYDGPHWKKGTQAPKQFKAGNIEVEVLNPDAAQSKAALIQLNPKLVFDFKNWKDGWNVDPRILARDNGIAVIELGKDPHLLNLSEEEIILRYGDPENPSEPTQAQLAQKEDDDIKIAAMKWLRSNKMHLIMITWEKTWRHVYKEYWDDLDFSKAQSGISGRESRKTTHFPITLEKPGEDKPGIVKELRKYTHTGAMSLDQLFAYESAINIFAEWDSNFAKVKGYAARLKGGDQLRAKLTGGQKPDLLNNPQSLANPTEAISEIRNHLKTYMSDSPEDQQEVNSITRDWVEAVAGFNKDLIHSYFPEYKNADSLTLDNIIYGARGAGLIDHHATEELANKLIGPLPWRAILVNKKLLSFSGGLFEMLKKMAQAIATGK